MRTTTLPAHSWRRWLWRGVLALLALALLMALVLWALLARSLPPLSGELRLTGLDAAVRVQRDASDVTHVFAHSRTDAWRALGFVHGSERAWQMEMNRRVIHGTLAEILGAQALPTDRVLRALNLPAAAQQQWLRLSDDVRAALAAYSAGVNAAHSLPRPPEFLLLQTAPQDWRPSDSLGMLLLMALDLNYNWGMEMARWQAASVLPSERVWQLLPPLWPKAWQRNARAPERERRFDLSSLYQRLGVFAEQQEVTSAALDAAPFSIPIGQPEGAGSNNWVIDAAHSVSGAPLLANDPHLDLAAPALWYMAALHVGAQDGVAAHNVIGATIPGLPFIVIGRNDDIAWGFTNTGADTQDLYLERLRGGEEYQTPRGWRRLSVREETIFVKGQGAERLRLRTTRHGPVISDIMSEWSVLNHERYAVSLRWDALAPDNQAARAAMALNEASTLEGALTALAHFTQPGQNVVLADRQHVAYQATGRVPKRREQQSLQGLAPAEGWLARNDWVGRVRATAMPHHAPAPLLPQGFIASANQDITKAAAPPFLGADWYSSERYDRIGEVLGAALQSGRKSNLDEQQRLQGDEHSLAARALLPQWRLALQSPEAQAVLGAEAVQRFTTFDGTMHADSAAPLLFAAWLDAMTHAIFIPKLGQEFFAQLYRKRDLRSFVHWLMRQASAGDADWWCAPLSCAEQSARALARAAQYLQKQFGAAPEAWRWGTAHPAISAHRPLDALPWLRRFVNVERAAGGDGYSVNVGKYFPGNAERPYAARLAPSLRLLFDLADANASRFILPTGQSGHPLSSRYRDMADEWVTQQTRPLWLNPTPEQIRKELVLLP